ncbi:MAG: hypothetical protein JNL39_01750 [Opitutaceae bacterium]|nr:hypothetical protein [Opitutaceae bacterium]
MPALAHRLALLVALAVPAAAAAPPALVRAIEHLMAQKSYSWETINSDPGPVAQQFETRRGTVVTIDRNLSPNVRGRLDRQGDMLIQREWVDGLRLDTIIGADGAVVTHTPEGWLSDREILTAQADARVNSRTATEHFQWLRRADRPDVRRPDQELGPLLRGANVDYETTGEGYIARIRSRAGDPAKPNDDEAEPGTSVTLVLNLRGGVIRDYEVKIEGIRRATRARVAVPISEQRIVVITYLPVSRIEAPAAALEKLAAVRRPATDRAH